MTANSKIAWTTHTFNPWIGCEKISPGCAHCYAETMNAHRGWVEWGPGKDRRKTSAHNWMEPLRWARKAKAAGVRERVFCASLADILDPSVPEEWFREVIRLVMATEDSLDWLFLTKREGELRRIPAMVREELAKHYIDGEVLPNLWVGVTAENQAMWNRRIPVLMTIPAVVRFVSAEPLLGLIDFDWALSVHSTATQLPDWVIVGGESGPGARPMESSWVLDLMRQCSQERIAFFFKQWGGVRKEDHGRILEGTTFDELPIPRRVFLRGSIP